MTQDKIWNARWNKGIRGALISEIVKSESEKKNLTLLGSKVLLR